MFISVTEWGINLWIGLEDIDGIWTWNGNTSDVLTYDGLWCDGEPDGSGVFVKINHAFCGTEAPWGHVNKYICESATCWN